MSDVVRQVAGHEHSCVREHARRSPGLQAYFSGGFRPDMIHAKVHAVALPSVIIGTLHRVPVVITERSSAFPRELLSASEAWKARVAFARAGAVLPVSEALRRSIEACGIQARFVCIPNVVDTTLFMPRGATCSGRAG